MASTNRFSRNRLFLLLTLVVAALCCTVFLPGLNTTGKTTSLTVHRGMGFMEITAQMQQGGTIKNQWQTVLTGRVIPGLHNIKPGRYTIPPNLSNFQLLYYLHTHRQDEVRITIPEGFEQRRIAALFSRNLDMDSSAFMKVVTNRKFLDRHAITGASAEGYLFPGTYNFAWGDSPEKAAAFLVGQFRRFFDDSLKARAATQGLNETSLLTLASIVEAETPLDAEKPVVASVYLNRLKKNMPLQADPTVQYALGEDARALYFKDLSINSPYNTYRHAGLPPGPICNPGAASIQAVLNPAETPYLYFVATGKGGHYFSATFAEHEKNVKKYRAARRNAVSRQ